MGYIKLERKILDWEWYKDPITRLVFLHILLKANWKDGSFLGVKIPRGAFATSVNKLAQDNCITFQQARTALKHLQSTNEITINSHAKFSVITVVKYNEYQTDNKVDNNEITINQQAEQQTPNNQVTTIEEYNNKKNKEKNNIRDYFSKDPALSDAFKDYNEMRQKRKKPMTDRSVKMFITALEKLSTDINVQVDLIDQATFRCWDSVYPLQNSFVSAREKTYKPQDATQNDTKIDNCEKDMTDEEWEQFVMSDEWDKR